MASKAANHRGLKNQEFTPREECEDELDDSAGELGVALKKVTQYVANKSIKQHKVEKLLEVAAALDESRKSQESVFIQIVYFKIGEIDTAKETFAADIFLQARWREPKFDGQINLNPNDINWKKQWNPKLDIDNANGIDPKDERWYTIYMAPDNKAFVVERRRIKGNFLENLELYQFPFDTQELNISIVSERSIDEVNLKDDPDEISTINVSSFVDEQEWHLYNTVETRSSSFDKYYQSPGPNTSCYTHSLLKATCFAGRRFQFHIWNILLIEFLLCCMSFNTFSVDSAKPENRLQLTFLLLLTTITFKTTITMGLPKISYLTYLDRYFLVCIVTLCLTCVWHAITSVIRSNNVYNALWIDRGILISFGTIYICGNICFIIFMVQQQRKERARYEESEKTHKQRVANQPANVSRFQDTRISTQQPVLDMNAGTQAAAEASNSSNWWSK